MSKTININNFNDSPYVLYGSGVTFNDNSTKEIIKGRLMGGDKPLYPSQNIKETEQLHNFLTPTWTREQKSANNASSIDYNRWEVFVNGKKNPVTAFNFMDDNLG